MRDLQSKYPRLQLVNKADHLLSRIIARLLWLLTLGRQRSYLEGVVTTLGSTVYLPRDWQQRSDKEKYLVMRHEAVHLAQFQRYGWFIMGIMYLCWPLPFGLAYGRARLEWEAYEESIRAIAELEGLQAARSQKLKDMIIKHFISANYGWMWPFPRMVESWFSASLRKIELAMTGAVASSKI